MNTLNAVIVEDEVNGQEALVALLELYCPTVKVVGIAGAVDEGVELIRLQKPDLVFLDIILGQENGFDLLVSLQPVNFQIIFTTSLDNYALKAFKANAVDYLMKPIEPHELVKAVEKARKLIGNDEFQDKFASMMNAFQEQQLERITIPSKTDGISIVEIQKIIYVNGSGAYSTFFLEDGQKILASNNLGYFVDLLPEKDFFRTHQSFLVNLKSISRVIPADGVVELINGVQIPLARSRRDGLLDRLA